MAVTANPQSFPFLFLFLFLSVVGGAAAVGGGRLGGWTTIRDLNDAHVVEIGNFSVVRHNEIAKTNLVFKNVVSAKSQVVAGTNYKLVVAAADGLVVKNYEAVVWEKPWQNFRNLTSFKAVKD